MQTCDICDRNVEVHTYLVEEIVLEGDTPDQDDLPTRAQLCKECVENPNSDYVYTLVDEEEKMKEHKMTKEQVLPLLSNIPQVAEIMWQRAKHSGLYICFSCHAVQEFSGELREEELHESGWRETEVGWLCRCCIAPEECAEKR